MSNLDQEIPPQRKTIIYFARHGESVGNTKRTHLAPEEDFLTEVGKTQAKLLGQFLSGEDFSAVISSTYPRALETAQIILSCNLANKRELIINPEPRLIERDFGLLSGEPIDRITQAFGESKTLLVEWDPKGAETSEQVNSRIYSFLQDLFKIIDGGKEQDEKILVISHASIILYLSKIFASDSEKFRVEGEKLNYVTAIPNSGFLKVAVHAQTPHPDSKKARTIEVLTTRGVDHLNQGNKDGNSTSGLTPNKSSTTSIFNEIAAANANN